jgi:hypothetical protein
MDGSRSTYEILTTKDTQDHEVFSLAEVTFVILVVLAFSPLYSEKSFPLVQ